MDELTLYLCRHGDTAWSAERRLAGRIDLELIPQGERNAEKLGQRLSGVTFRRALVSPLLRARRTAELAGIPAAIDDRLLEMDFGDYDGHTVEDVRRERPGWTYLADGCPGGEGPDDLGRRADSLLDELGSLEGNVALFAHSVILRVLAARFLGLPAGSGRILMLSPSALSILTYDPIERSRAIAIWNDRQHLTVGGGFG